MVGYSLVGSDSATCQEDGSFSQDIPTCTRMNSIAEYLIFYLFYILELSCGRIMGPNNGKVRPEQNSYSVGDIVTFICDDGYQLDSNIDESICMSTGEFNNMAPNCKRVTCSSPIAPDNGSIYLKQTVYNYGDTVTYRCNPGYSLEGFSEAMCQSDGSYSNKAPSCRRKTKWRLQHFCNCSFI